jgi:hypothetical protein
MRYNNSKILNDKTGVKYLSSRIYPKILPNDNDIYIISEAGDRLDLLANKYYQTPSLWWIIAVANNLNDANFSIEPGLQLRIPSNVNEIVFNLQKINK